MRRFISISNRTAPSISLARKSLITSTRHQRQTFEDSLQKAHNMSSDADYAAFLDKANQETGSANTQSKSKSAKIKAINTEVPKALEEVDVYFMSDADEPFEPVSLKYVGTDVPDADEMAKLMGGSLTSISQNDFDPRGQYKTVIEAVEKAGNGSCGFFKAELDRTRVQYVVVSVDTKHKRIVGLKALAVES